MKTSELSSGILGRPIRQAAEPQTRPGHINIPSGNLT